MDVHKAGVRKQKNQKQRSSLAVMHCGAASSLICSFCEGSLWLYYKRSNWAVQGRIIDGRLGVSILGTLLLSAYGAVPISN